jgi:cellulose synthase/poly-beta-1,6-N-acetylglucosamine synthase-like glycosyltransferase
MELNYPMDRLDIIAVDNSDDCSIAERVSQRFPTIRLLTGKHSPGSDATKQAGINAATGEIVALTDADCRVSPGWARAIAKSLADDIDVVTGPVRHPTTLMREMIGISDFQDFQGEGFCWKDAFPGCNVAFKRTGAGVRYQARKGMAFGSDRITSWRMHTEGYRIWYNPGMEVWHFPPGDLRRFISRRLRYGRKALLLRQIDPSLPGSVIVRLGPLAAPAYVCYKSVKDITCLLSAACHHHVDARHIPLLIFGLLTSRAMDACGIIKQQLTKDW